METDIKCTPPEIQKSLETSLHILPQKSVEKYNRQYDIFIEWCKQFGFEEYTEDVLLAYFSDLSKEYSPSSMWSYYSMVKATLSANNDVDISTYKKLTAFLKQKGKNHIPQKSKTLLQEEIVKFLLDAPDEIYLMMKICVVFGISGALRNEELLNLKVSDIEDKQTILVVHITKTKSNKPRLFLITAEFEEKVEAIKLFNKYLALRPKETPHDRFFLTYKNGKCTVQPVGIHTFGSIPSKIASFLHLPEPSLYTGHCFRRTSKENLKRHRGWKTETIAESYAEKPVHIKPKIAKTISSDSQTGNIVVINDSSTNDVKVVENYPQTFSIQTSSNSGINIYNASGCTFTFNITSNK